MSPTYLNRSAQRYRRQIAPESDQRGLSESASEDMCSLSANRVTRQSPEGGSRHPSRKCPNAASGRTRSQMILVIASIGIERIAPGAPHIQNQKTTEMMTRTGLRRNRLARSVGVIT